MKILKSHFKWYTKSQRRGIFSLLLIIIILQITFVLIDFSSTKTITTSDEILAFQQQIDSLKLIEIEKKKPGIYPFNPNFISDFKGYQLGMSTEEIDRLHQFREQNKWINSTTEFQQITKVPDNLLAKISPYFKFPDWVTKKEKTTKKLETTISKKQDFKQKEIIKISTNDINKATADDFKTINGIGKKLSERIIKYRKKLQGFTFENQLNEVWGLDKKIVSKVLNTFEIIKKPTINKIDINSANFKEVLRTPYVDYELCKKIFDYRDEVTEIQNITELKKIDGFPLEKYEKIILYLKTQ